MIEHASRCARRRPPILRASWNRSAELWCPECGRTCPATDTRTTNSKEAR